MSGGGGPQAASIMANSTQHQQQSQQQNSQQQQPTQQHQVPSKRDKRRNLLSDRLTDLSVSFDKDRDVHYRSQLAALQQDFNAIARADTSGRDMKMLDDGAEGIDKFVTGGVFLGGNASGADGAVPNARGAGPGVVGGVQPGTFYAGFVAEVNERMEERDVGLTMLHRQYHAKLASLKSSHERNIHHAREEHIHLAVTMKQRLINRLYNAKKKLSLDKEHLDISDTSAMLLHPNQFTIGAGPGGVLGSPGRDLNDRSGNLGDIFGSGGNGANGSTGGRRKLRQRRNELEDLMMMGPGGIFDNFGTSRDRDHAGNSESAAKSAAQRRKARAARHNRRATGGTGADDDDNEDIYGNVGGGAITPSGTNSGGNSGVGAAQLASMLQKQQSSSGGSQSQAVYNSHTSNGIGAGTTSNAQELLVKPVWSIDKLFTEKELQMAGNLAALATVKYFSAPKEKRAAGGKKTKKDGTTGDDEGDVLGTDDNTDGTRTPREPAVPGEGSSGSANIAAITSSATALDDPFQSKTKDKDAATHSTSNTGANSNSAGSSGNASSTALPDLSNTPLPPTPSTLFSSLLSTAASHHNTRSSGLHNGTMPLSQTPLINSASLAHAAPPTLAALNFMTPTSAGYGSASWQQLGVPASYFSAGSGTVINSSRTVTLQAPGPPAVRPDEGAEDLDNIRKGVEIPIPEVEIFGAYSEEDITEVDRSVVQPHGNTKAKGGRKGKKTGGVSAIRGGDIEMVDAMATEKPEKGKSSSHSKQHDTAAPVGLGLINAGVDARAATGVPATSSTAPNSATLPTASGTSEVNSPVLAVPGTVAEAPASATTSHGVKRRATAASGPNEKRARKAESKAAAAAASSSAAALSTANADSTKDSSKEKEKDAAVTEEYEAE